MSYWRQLVLTTFLATLAGSTFALEGQVVDATTGHPVIGATVTRGSEVTRTDDEGHYHLDGTDDTVAARAAGYGRVRLTFPPGEKQLPPLHLVPIRPKALYLSFWGIGDSTLRTSALRLAASTEINALVIDVKGDRGWIPFSTKLPMADAIGARRYTTVHDMPALMARLKESGLYLIARIVVFKDDVLASAHPEWAAKTSSGILFRDRENLAWVDPACPEVWAYNLDIAAEAAELGFDEIQFDYLRFPDSPGLNFSVPNTEPHRVAAISGFLTAARKRLAQYNVFLAADIFGYVFWNLNDTAIGQKLETLSGQLDYLSPMLYPSGFKFGIPGYHDPVAHPYEIVYQTLKRGAERTGLPAVRFHPWLQAFRDYAFDQRDFTGHELRLQIDAADAFGSGGWMLWNPHNSYSGDGLKQK